MRCPHAERTPTPSGKTVLTLHKVELGLELGDKVFMLEDPDAKEPAKE